MNEKTTSTSSGANSAESDDGLGAEDGYASSGIAPETIAFALIGMAALGALVVLRDPALRASCVDVLRDSEVHAVCREAGKNVVRAVAASWRDHGGPAAFASAAKSFVA